MSDSTRAVMWVTSVSGALLVAALVNAALQGSWDSDLHELWENPWALATLVDAYVGFVLIGLWIAFRERSRAAAAVWIVALLALGNLVSLVYVARAALLSRGDPTLLLTGAGHTSRQGPSR